MKSPFSFKNTKKIKSLDVSRAIKIKNILKKKK